MVYHYVLIMMNVSLVFMVVMYIQIVQILMFPIHVNVTIDLKVMGRCVMTLMNVKAKIHAVNSKNV